MKPYRSGIRSHARTAPFRAALLLATAAAAALPGTAVAGPLHDALGAPEALTLEGSIRSRFEGIEGHFRPAAAEDDFLWSLRTSLFAEYDAGPVRLGGQLIDARGYGQDRNSSARTGEVNAAELVQAYLRLDLEGVAGAEADAGVTAGRFLMHIGAGRVVATHGFRNTVNGFTGAKLDWEGAGGDRLLAFWTMPQIRLPSDVESIRDNEVEWDEETSDLQFFGGSYAKAGLIPLGTVEAYALKLNERDSDERATKNRRLTTLGARASRAPGKGPFDFDLEAAYQFGSTRASTSVADQTDLDVSAGFFHGEIGKRFAATWSPRLSVHLDYGSGDGRDPGEYNRFDSLFGSSRGDFGPSALYGALGRANIVSTGLRLDAAPSKRWDGFVAYGAAWLEEDVDSFASTGVRDASGLSGTFGAHQIEGRVRHWMIPERVRAEAGAAFLFKSSFLRDAPNAPDTGDTRYAYFDLTFEF